MEEINMEETVQAILGQPILQDVIANYRVTSSPVLIFNSECRAIADTSNRWQVKLEHLSDPILSVLFDVNGVSVKHGGEEYLQKRARQLRGFIQQMDDLMVALGKSRCIAMKAMEDSQHRKYKMVMEHGNCTVRLRVAGKQNELIGLSLREALARGLMRIVFPA